MDTAGATEEQKHIDAAIAASAADEKNKIKMQRALKEQDHAAATLIQKRQRGNISRSATVTMKEAKAKTEKEEAERLTKEPADKPDGISLLDYLADQLAKDKKDKEEAERLAKDAADKAEAERVAKARAEKEKAKRLAKEKAEKEEAERSAKEAADKAETERVAKQRAEKEEAERLAKETADKGAAERRAQDVANEADGIVAGAINRAETKRLAKNKAEAKRLIKEADGIVAGAINHAEAKRLAKEASDKAEAKEAADKAAAKRRAANEADGIVAGAINRAETKRLAKDKAEAKRLIKEADGIVAGAINNAEAKRLSDKAKTERLAKEAADKAEAERLAKEAAEKAAIQRRAQDVANEADGIVTGAINRAEAKRLAKDKAEAKRLIKEADEIVAGAINYAEAKRLAKEAADKAEAERMAKEAADKAEAERLAKEAAAKAEADRLTKEKAEKEEAERLAKQQVAMDEAVRLAKEQAYKEEAERLAKEAAAKAETDRLTKEKTETKEAERLAKQKLRWTEAMRLAKEQAYKEETERLAKEAAAKAEADRLTKEKAVKEEAERLAKQRVAMDRAVRLAKVHAYREVAERLAKEAAAKAEADRLTKEKTEKEEAERLAKQKLRWTEAMRLAKEQTQKEVVEMIAMKQSMKTDASTSTKHLEIWWKEKDFALDVENARQQQIYERVAPRLPSLPAAGDTALRAFTHAHRTGKGGGTYFVKARLEQKMWNGMLEAVTLAKVVLTNPKDSHDLRHMQRLKRLVDNCGVLQREIQRAQSPQLRMDKPLHLHLGDIKHVLADVQEQNEQSAVLLNSLSERIASTNSPQARRQIVSDLVAVDILGLSVVDKAGARDTNANAAVKSVGMFRTLLHNKDADGFCVTAACVRVMHGLCSTSEGRTYIRSHEPALRLLVRVLLLQQANAPQTTRARLLSILQTLSLNVKSARTMLAVSLNKDDEPGGNSLSKSQKIPNDLCKTLLELLANDIKAAGQMAEEYAKVQTDQLGAAVLVRDSPDCAVDHWRQLQQIEARADGLPYVNYTLALVVNLLHASLPGWRPSAPTVWLQTMVEGLVSMVCCCDTLWPRNHTYLARVALRLAMQGAAQTDAAGLMVALRNVQLVERLQKNEVGADPDGSLLSLATQLRAGKIMIGAESGKEDEAEDDTVDELTDFESDEEEEEEAGHRVAASAILHAFNRPPPQAPSPSPLLVGCSVAVRWPSILNWEKDTGTERWFRRSELVDCHTGGGRHILELQQQLRRRQLYSKCMLPDNEILSSDSGVVWVQGAVTAVLHGRPEMVWPSKGGVSEEDGVCYLVHSLSRVEEGIEGKVEGAETLVDMDAHAGVEQGDLTALEQLLSRRLNVDLLNEDGQSLLTAAAGFGHVDIVQQLVYKKADVNHKAKDGTVPIVMAAFNGSADVVHTLLRTNHVDVLARFGEEGSTALHIAAKYNKIEAVEAFCKGVYPNSHQLINYETNEGDTALLLAAQEGHEKVTEILLRDLSRCDVNCINDDGASPTYVASELSRLRVLRLLIQAKGDVNAAMYGHDYAASCLEMATQKSHHHVVKVLLDAKARPDHPEHAITEAMMAARAGDLDIVCLLLDAKADPENRRDKNGQSVVDILAAEHGVNSLAEARMRGREMTMALDHDDKDESWLKGMLALFDESGKVIHVAKAIKYLDTNPLMRVVEKNVHRFDYMLAPGDGDAMFMDRVAFEAAFQRVGS